jgi:hypothetical protein
LFLVPARAVASPAFTVGIESTRQSRFLNAEGAHAMMDWNGWPGIVVEQVLVGLALLAVLEGGRRIVRDGFSRLPALMLAIGLAVPVGDGWLNMNLIKQVRELQTVKMTLAAARGREPAGGWEKVASTPEARTLASTEAGSVAYRLLGERITIIDAAGTRIPFQPTADEMREREQLIRDEKGAEGAALTALDHGLRLLIETAFFLLAGLFLGWRARRRA